MPRKTENRTKQQSQYCGGWEDERLGGAVGNFGKELAGEVPEAFLKCRQMKKFNWFVRAVLGLRKDFYNFKLRIVPDGKNATETKDWLDAGSRRNEAMLKKFVSDSWTEYLLADVVISFWRKQGSRALLLSPEVVTYKDKFGAEVLTFPHGLSYKEIDDFVSRGILNAKEGEILKASPRVTLKKGDTEGLNRIWSFEVLKKEVVGRGLGEPSLISVLQASEQSLAMEVGDNLWAQLGRKVYEQHRVGHEIKNNTMAGSNKNFLKKPMAQAIESATKGKTGVLNLVTNFDHFVEFHRPDPKFFEPKKYDAVVNRMLWWALPLGHMVLAKGLNPELMGILRTMALEARGEMGMHLEYVINESFDLPGPVRLEWDGKIFKDSRAALELLKMGLQSGPLSQTTFIEESGYDTTTERARKLEESKLPESQTMPLYDAHHGPMEGTPGRKKGSPDRTNKGG
jgi:hypothetical protein